MSHPALFAPPDPRAVRRALELPIAALGALLAHPVLLHVSEAVSEAGRPRGGWAAVAVCTALISVAHFRISTSGKTWRSVLLRSVLFGVLLGPLNSGISLAAVTALKSGAEPDVIGAFMLGTLFGSVAGGLIGFAFGLGYAPLAIAASAHRERPTYAGPEKARAAAGVLVIGAASVHHAFIPGLAGFQTAGAVFGAALLAYALYRLIGLELFLRAVRRGSEPQWSLTAPRDPSDVAGLVPIHGSGASDAILYRAAADSSLMSPYRAQSQWIPIARLA